MATIRATPIFSPNATIPPVEPNFKLPTKEENIRNEKGTVIGGDITITLEVRKKQS